MERNTINQTDVQNLYNSMQNIWPEDDCWYTYTHQQIWKYLKKAERQLCFYEKTLILNAGSAGNDYEITGKHIHLDIAEKHLKGLSDAIVGSVENIPIANNTFDACICVGSVINYCDAMAAISELSRVLKPSGYLILDYDQSKSFEFIGTHTYNKNAEIVNTFNSGFNDKIWVYSDKYITNILEVNGFSLLRKKYYHNISPLFLKLLKDENKASKFAPLDRIVQHMPLINRISCNIILTAQLI